MKDNHWTSEEYREFLRTGREPIKMPERRRGYHSTPPRSVQNDTARMPVMDCGGIIPLQRVPEEPKRRKYGNEPAYIDGKRFDSKHEAMVYKDLMMRVKAGELKCVIRQVRFDLAQTENLQYVADFVTIAPDMTVDVIDAKSEATRKNKVYVIKKKLMREVWGLEIREV